MPEPLKLSLPWPPSVNTYWRHVSLPTRGGRLAHKTLISEKGRRYRERVKLALADLFHSSNRHQRAAWFDMRGRLAVRLVAHPPDRRARDLDNLPKAILDALQYGGVYADDSQIDYLQIERADRAPGGRIELRVWHAPDLEAPDLNELFSLMFPLELADQLSRAVE